jgi:hypothetical protein
MDLVYGYRKVLPALRNLVSKGRQFFLKQANVRADAISINFSNLEYCLT